MLETEADPRSFMRGIELEGRHKMGGCLSLKSKPDAPCSQFDVGVRGVRQLLGSPTVVRCDGSGVGTCRNLDRARLRRIFARPAIGLLGADETACYKHDSGDCRAQHLIWSRLS